MEKIKRIFLTETIPDCMDEKYGPSFIKFVFDEKTLKDLSEDFEKEYQIAYKSRDIITCETILKGQNTIVHLWKNLLEYKNGSDDVFIQIHDSNKFFSYLQELINLYSQRKHYALLNPKNFIRSIWLRMDAEDINNVEGFLQKQMVFIKNERFLNDGCEVEFAQINEKDRLVYKINENEDWFETNKNIIFSILRKKVLLSSDLSFEEYLKYFDSDDEYDFPAIHFAFAKENNRPTCFLYGIQQLPNKRKDDDIKEFIQPIRKKLRNKYVSSDILIALSLFFDFLYKKGIKDVNISTMQVLNYQFHEQLSKNYHYNLDKYSEYEKQKIEERYNSGDTSEEVIEYIYLKRNSKMYMDRQDDISYNKSERLINAIMELCERYPVLDVTSYPYIEGENMHIKINGEINILNSSSKKQKF